MMTGLIYAGIGSTIYPKQEYNYSQSDGLRKLFQSKGVHNLYLFIQPQPYIYTLNLIWKNPSVNTVITYVQCVMAKNSRGFSDRQCNIKTGEIPMTHNAITKCLGKSL